MFAPSKEQSTYWGKTFFDGLVPPWKLEYREGKGYFAIAARAFIAGDLICIETPTTWCRGWHPFDETQIQEIRQGVESLQADERNAFLDMANVFPEVDPCAGIYMTNSFDMVGSAEPSCGMYLAIARLNHSCCPNVQQTHIPETMQEVVYATRDIAEGEELNDSYIELRQNTADRRRELMQYYRFHCTCIACCPNGAIDTIDDYPCSDDASVVALASRVTCESISERSAISKQDIIGVDGISVNDTGLNARSNDKELCVPLQDANSLISDGDVTSQRSELGSNYGVSTEGIVPLEVLQVNIDAARVRAKVLDDRIMVLVEEGHVEAALECAQDLLRCLEASSNKGWCERYLAEAHLNIFHIGCSLMTAERTGSAIHKKFRKLARKHIIEAHRWNIKLQGERSSDSVATQAYLEDLS